MASSSGSFGSGFMVVIAIVIIFGVLRCMVCDDGSEGQSFTSKSEPEKPESDHDALSAWIICQTFVKKHLKSPSTASFGGLFDDYQDPETHAISADDGKYICKGYVDAQNSFGATIRNQFILTVQYVGNGEWKLLGGPVIQ